MFQPMFGRAGISRASRRRMISTVPGLFGVPSTGPCMNVGRTAVSSSPVAAARSHASRSARILESGYARTGLPDGAVHVVSVAGVSGSPVSAVTPDEVSTARLTPARAAAPSVPRPVAALEQARDHPAGQVAGSARDERRLTVVTIGHLFLHSH